jgi:predicted amidohydrolase YtcJ
MGSIKAGKLANMVILSADVCHMPTARIRDAAVLCTIFEGEIVYGGIS